MKSIVTTDITASAAAKIKKGTLDHINAMASEGPVQLAISLIGADYDNTKAYILYGCEDSNASATVFDMSAGLVLWAGELLYTPAQSITVSAGQTIRFYPTPSYTTSAAADPVTFTDGTTHNIHLNNGGVWVGAATGSTATLLPNMINAYNPIKVTVSSYGSKVSSGSIICRKNRANMVSIQGDITFSSLGLSTESVCTLPSGYKPNVILYNIPITDGSAIILITINTSGNVQATTLSGTLASKTIYVNNIHFYTY